MQGDLHESRACQRLKQREYLKRWLNTGSLARDDEGAIGELLARDVLCSIGLDRLKRISEYKGGMFVAKERLVLRATHRCTRMRCLYKRCGGSARRLA